MQLIMRLVLGISSWHAICHYASSIKTRFKDDQIGDLLLLLLAFTFHVPFYASRTLPNIFAFILVTHGWAYWLKRKPYACIGLLTLATVIFRCDMLILLGPLTLQMLLSKEISFIRTLKVGILSGMVSLGLTVLIDSLFWQRYVWPEGVVLFFNTVQNRSSEWGIMPWHWYFSNALVSLHIHNPFKIFL